MSGRRMVFFSALLALVAASCGDDAPPVFATAATEQTVATGPGSSSIPPPPGDDDVLSVVLDGVGWDVPRVACEAGSDPGSTATAAASRAERVRALVVDRVSGWPTTTVASQEDDAAFLEVEMLGPLALALARMAGSPDPIVDRWAEFEAGFADPSGEWGPVTEISRRLPAWRAIAERLVPEIEAACAIATGDIPTPSEAAATDLRVVDGGELGRKGTIRVTIGPGDMSILAHARTGDPDALVFVTAVLDPNGDDVGEMIGLEYGELSNYGEAAVFVPVRDDADLVPGEYRIAFEATAPIVESGAIVKTGDPDVAMAVDVVFWMATNVDYDRVALEQRFRSIGTQLFSPHGISVGTISFVDPPQSVVDRFSVLEFYDDTDAELRALCREMSSGVGAVRAVNVAIVDRLDDGDPEAVIEGSSSGLPGTAMSTNSDLSCVAGMAAIDPEFGNRDLFDRAIVVWHEAGHHFGLYHTSEGDGRYFDLFDDTPECRIEERDDNDDGWIDLYECDGLDADNFMFYDGDGLDITDDQAWMVRRHPLLYPMG